ncbi:MAG: aldo/keto reductase [Candidatus Omnitrophota bacterium]
MNYRELGNTGLKVSELGMGCWALGGDSYGSVEEKDALAALETAWEGGVNFFDTADMYGLGRSEKIVGQFLKGKPRERILIASKAGHDFYRAGGIKKNFEPAYLRLACEKSLGRLGVDSIDLYQLHSATVEALEHGEAIGEFVKLRDEGKIRAIGVTVWSEEEALAALRDPRIQSIQLIVNLIDRRMVPKVLPSARAQKIGILAREPLAKGLLSGKYGPDSHFPERDHRQGWSREKLQADLAKVREVQEQYKALALPLKTLALRYVIGIPGVTTVIPGAKSAGQFRDHLAAISQGPIEGH